MRVVIIGGNGFIGRNLADYLHTSNHEIIVYDRNKLEIPRQGITYVQGDLNDDLLLNEVIEQDDCVIHLGCTSVPSNSNRNIENDVMGNLLPTIKLLDVCKRKLVKKIIFASSGGSIYGVPKYTPIDENHPTEPLSIYGIHKLTIEKYLSVFYSQTGIQTISLRISNPYGPGQRPFTGQGVIPTFLASALLKKDIEIWGNGFAVRDYIYIEDLCEVISKFLYYNGIEKIFNIGSSQGTSVNTVLEHIKNLVDCKVNVIYKEAYGVEVNSNILDCQKVNQSLQWVSRTSLQEGIHKMMQVWDDQKISF